MVHLSATELELGYEGVERLPNGETKAACYILYGLSVEGEHHKQWCLERAAEALDIDLAAVNAWRTDEGYAEIKPGIAP